MKIKPFLTNICESCSKFRADFDFKFKIDPNTQNSLTNTKIFLFGFSQGAMIALHYGLRDEESFGGILAFSGSLISPERLSEIKNKTPVMLVHGEIDEVVPFSEMIKASKALEQNGINIEKYSVPNLGHGIDDFGINRALE